MNRSRLKLVRQAQADDLSFPPPFDEQAKYLKLADDFLARTSSEQQRTKDKVQSIDTGRHLNNRKSKRAAEKRQGVPGFASGRKQGKIALDIREVTFVKS